MGVVVYLVLMNCKCGRVLMDKMSNKKNNISNDDLIINDDDLIVDIMKESNNNTGQRLGSDLLEV